NLNPLSGKVYDLIVRRFLSQLSPQEMKVVRVEKKTTRKNPPLLYNLAEIQNDCSRFYKISPDQTLNIIQELYEKKLVTYPRTDARVLSTAISKEINRNIGGLRNYSPASSFASEILENGAWKGIGKTRYTNDKQITDHYAIIPTGQGLQNLKNLNPLSGKVYDLIVRRFLSIFYPPAVYQKVSLENQIETEHFFSTFSVLTEEGYLKLSYRNPGKKTASSADGPDSDNAEEQVDTGFLEALKQLHKGSILPIDGYKIKEGETSPPKRYTSGSMILAMENAGQLIEDEELREQIKGSGIGTSATRAEILKKLFHNKYLELNKKTQVITPTQIGEMIHDVVYCSIRSLLNPDLTASWEKGLTYVAEGTIEPAEYLNKLETFVASRTNAVKQTNNRALLQKRYDYIAQFYRKPSRKASSRKNTKTAEAAKGKESIRKA
ncbi:MAG: DNA topoisomerase, partial [Lachnospiraceae bacterium]|nr:DNA topoisomerase [Lachnospiraceae bacterium]